MAQVRSVYLCVLVMAVGLMTGYCGDKPGGGGDPDAAFQDGAVVDATMDASTLGDATVDDDAGSSPTERPFLSVTSGGDSLSSANYSMTLYVAPIRPVGSANSTNYQIELGPASHWRLP